MLQDLKPIKEEGQQSEAEQEVVSHVKKKVEDIRTSASRVASEGIWMTNIAYTLGYSGVTFNTLTRSFQPIARMSSGMKRDKLHVNKILPTLQNRLAKLCKNPPKFDIRPESNDTEDKEAARLSEQVLLSLWQKLSMDEKRIVLGMWVQECGHAYVKISWDPTLGNGVTDPLSGEFMFEGDVRGEIVSPFEIFPDPLAMSFDDIRQSWLIQAKVRKLDYFKTQYPERGAAVREEDVWLLSAQYQSRINSMNTRSGSDSNEQGTKNCAIELIKYEARSKEHPNGRMIVTANGILLEDKELPVGEIPFRKFDDVVIGGKYYSESTVTHLRPIQDQYNAVIRRRAEWTKKLLAGKYSAAKGSGLQQEAMNDGTEIVYYQTVPTAPNGGQPTAIQVPNIPQWAYNEEESLDKQFNEISGISDISKGILPSASIPALGMQILQEADESRVGITTTQHEQAWAGVASLILKYVERFYVTPRKLKISGKNLQYTVKTVQGQEIRGNTDVAVVPGSTLPKSQALQRQDLQNAFDHGYLGPPQDPEVLQKTLGLMEFGDVQGMWEDFGLDSHQIKKGIDELEKGEYPPISEFDNHAMWLRELNRYRKGDKFESLSPEIRALFLTQMEERLQQVLELSGQVPPPVSDEEVQGKMAETEGQDMQEMAPEIDAAIDGPMQ